MPSSNLHAVCLVFAVAWAVYAARNYESPRDARDDDDETSAGKKRTIEEHYKIVSERFNELGNQTILTDESFRSDELQERQPPELVNGDDSDTSDDESILDVDLEAGPDSFDGHIVVHRNIDADNTAEELAAPNCCAICIEAYSSGDEVVWSTNERCYHVYHKHCIATYFAHAKRKGKTKLSCPTCRQKFLVLEEDSGTEEGRISDEDRGLAEATSIVEETLQARQQRMLRNRV